MLYKVNLTYSMLVYAIVIISLQFSVRLFLY